MTNTTKEVRANKRAANAPKRKQLIETAKTFFIVISVTAALAFIGGMKYADAQHQQVQNAVNASLQSK